MEQDFIDDFSIYSTGNKYTVDINPSAESWEDHITEVIAGQAIHQQTLQTVLDEVRLLKETFTPKSTVYNSHPDAEIGAAKFLNVVECQKRMDECVQKANALGKKLADAETSNTEALIRAHILSAIVFYFEKLLNGASIKLENSVRWVVPFGTTDSKSIIDLDAIEHVRLLQAQIKRALHQNSTLTSYINRRCGKLACAIFQLTPGLLDIGGKIAPDTASEAIVAWLFKVFEARLVAAGCHIGSHPFIQRARTSAARPSNPNANANFQKAIQPPPGFASGLTPNQQAFLAQQQTILNLQTQNSKQLAMMKKAQAESAKKQAAAKAKPPTEDDMITEDEADFTAQMDDKPVDVQFVDPRPPTDDCVTKTLIDIYKYNRHMRNVVSIMQIGQKSHAAPTSTDVDSVTYLRTALHNAQTTIAVQNGFLLRVSELLQEQHDIIQRCWISAWEQSLAPAPFYTANMQPIPNLTCTEPSDVMFKAQMVTDDVSDDEEPLVRNEKKPELIQTEEETVSEEKVPQDIIVVSDTITEETILDKRSYLQRAMSHILPIDESLLKVEMMGQKMVGNMVDRLDETHTKMSATLNAQSEKIGEIASETEESQNNIVRYVQRLYPANGRSSD